VAQAVPGKEAQLPATSNLLSSIFPASLGYRESLLEPLTS
jgi:hypothetical protein